MNSQKMHPEREHHQRPCTVWMAEPPQSGSLKTSRASLSGGTSDACDTTTVAANNRLTPAVRVQLMSHGREHHKRSPTVWTDKTWDRLLNPSCPFSWKPTFDASDTNAVAAATIAYPSTRAQLVPTGLSAPKVLPMAKNPWKTYEPIFEIEQGSVVLLARHRERKAELVHIQKLQESSSTAVICDSVSQLSHPSFRSLLECYHDAGHAFLVWEPVALSVTQILESKCLITEREIAAIVRPVLEGIRHLQARGKVLAALDADTILLTEAGGIRIAGVEASCEISTSEMDCTTLKLLAMAKIVARLLRKNPLSYQWSAAAEMLPSQLRSQSVEKLLQGDFLRQHQQEGELKMLVSVANKTAHHRVGSLSDRS